MTTIANAGFANHSIHAVASLAAYVRQPVEAAGYTHFIVSNGEVTFLAFHGS